MANQNAIQDDNQLSALIGQSGTAGTAETRRAVVTAGSQWVTEKGTVPVDIVSGTVNLVEAGTITSLEGGTLNMLEDGTLSQSQSYGYNGTNWHPTSIDTSTRAFNVIDYEHHEIHGGSHFYVAGYDTFAADGDIDFQVTTPNTTKWAHMLFEVQSTGETVFTIYEGAAVGTATAVVPINSNRNSSGSSVLAIQADGAVNTAGSVIYAQAFGYANTPTRISGGGDRSAHEIILKQNTTYRFFIESNSADNIISYAGFWYEHTDKAA